MSRSDLREASACSLSSHRWCSSVARSARTPPRGVHGLSDSSIGLFAAMYSAPAPQTEIEGTLDVTQTARMVSSQVMRGSNRNIVSGSRTMNRNSRNRLLLFFALFHLLSDVAYAGAAVLCVGPDDHRAVESKHAVEAGCQKFDESAPLGVDVTGRARPSSECSDRPLHSEAELRSSHPSPTDPPSFVLAFAPAETLADSSNTLIRARARAPADSTALRAHRTTVLII